MEDERMGHVDQSSDHSRVQYHKPDRAGPLIWKALNRVALDVMMP